MALPDRAGRSLDGPLTTRNRSMRPLVPLVLSAVAVLALELPARAQSPATDHGASRDTLHVAVPGVEVTALRGRESVRDVPAATFVLSRSDLTRVGAARLSTVLATLPGLFAYRQNASGEPSVI